MFPLEKYDEQEQGEPAFYGFMDKNDCRVNICYTPWAAGGPNNELPTAYYTTPQQRKPLTVEEAALQLAEAIVRSTYDNAK